VRDALSRDQRIGMVQPRDAGDPPSLFDVGCVGKIGHVEALDDGRYNIILEGLSRFRIRRELSVDTAFRQVEADLIADDDVHQTLGLMERASLEREAKRFADAQGYAVDWNAVGRLDDEAIVNGIAQVAPFDIAAKQALLEANSLSDRAELTMQLMQFFGRHDGDGQVTLQ
jgi:Lon protease-like protein